MKLAATKLAALRRAVHAACRQLGLEEDERRDMLQGVAGVRSTTQLDLAACSRVLDHLKKSGAALKQHNVGQHPGNPETARPGAADLMAKIEAQLADMQLPWKYALTILQHTSADKRAGKPGVEKLEWATPTQLHKVVAALAYEQEKRGLLSTVDELLVMKKKTRADVAAFIVSKRPDYKKDWTRDKRWLNWLVNHIEEAL